MAKFVMKAADGKTTEIEVPDAATIDLVVNGQTVTVPASALAAGYQKGLSADQKFQEAAAMRKQSEEGLLLTQLAKEAEFDDTAFRKLGAMLGHDPATTEEMLSEFRAGTGGGGGAGDDDDDDDAAAATAAAKAGKKGKTVQAPRQPQQQVIPQDVLARIDTAHTAVVDSARERGMKLLRDALDRHPQLGKLSEARKDFLLGSIEDVRNGTAPTSTMAGYVSSRLKAGVPLGPSLLDEAVEKTFGVAQQLAILPGQQTPEEAATKAKDFADRIAAGGIGLGPSGDALSKAVQAGKAPDRKPVTDPEAEDVMALRALSGEYNDPPETTQQ